MHITTALRMVPYEILQFWRERGYHMQLMASNDDYQLLYVHNSLEYLEIAKINPDDSIFFKIKNKYYTKEVALKLIKMPCFW